MRINDAPERLALKYSAEIERIGEDEFVFTNPENGKTIRIVKDLITEDLFVLFATQHRHYEEFEDALDYAEQLMRDEILAIEYYAGSEPRFGGDIERSELEDPSSAPAGSFFSLSPRAHPGLDYEINSWSGQYDLKYITT